MYGFCGAIVLLLLFATFYGLKYTYDHRVMYHIHFGDVIVERNQDNYVSLEDVELQANEVEPYFTGAMVFKHRLLCTQIYMYKDKTQQYDNVRMTDKNNAMITTDLKIMGNFYHEKSEE